METRDAKKYNLGDVTIYICPACGVVNPAGPSDGCPHLQVVKFNGVDESLEELVMDVATARRKYGELAATLKRVVMARVQEGSASVETPRRVSAGEIDKLYSEAGNRTFELTHPEEKSAKNKISSKKSKGRKKPLSGGPLDARQLDLLAYSPSKGNA
ncbi:MAG: hypothetical protein JXX29_04125 [Deltaproteobacteria bacterium]|nr:hypothetical protein [Deltaproteobacteria bacterium]MBN2670831.1 hypothetical protein [Deltaproteobacteria bacterium]